MSGPCRRKVFKKHSRNTKNHSDETEHRISRPVQPRGGRPFVDPCAGELYGLRNHTARRDRRPCGRRRHRHHQQGAVRPYHARTPAPPAADLRGRHGNEPHRPGRRGRTGRRREERRGLLDPFGHGDDHRRRHRTAAPDRLLRPLREGALRRGRTGSTTSAARPTSSTARTGASSGWATSDATWPVSPRPWGARWPTPPRRASSGRRSIPACRSANCSPGPISCRSTAR